MNSHLNSHLAARLSHATTNTCSLDDVWLPHSTKRQRSPDQGSTQMSEYNGNGATAMRLVSIVDDVAVGAKMRRSGKSARQRSDIQTPAGADEARNTIQEQRIVYDKKRAYTTLNSMKSSTGMTDDEKPTTSVSSSLIKDEDVLFGRGKAYFEHYGNTYFRRLCAGRLDQYRVASTRSKKVSIIYEILNDINALGGRFLKRDHNGCWHETSADIAKQKTGHTLRDALVKLKKDVMKTHEKKGVKRIPSPTISSSNASLHSLGQERLDMRQVVARQPCNDHNAVGGEEEYKLKSAPLLLHGRRRLLPLLALPCSVNQFMPLQPTALQKQQPIDQYWDNPVDSDELQDDLISFEGDFFDEDLLMSDSESYGNIASDCTVDASCWDSCGLKEPK